MIRGTVLFMAATLLAASATTAVAQEPRPVPAQVFKVGGDVKVPVILHRTEPVIPAGAPCRSIVILDTIIDETGQVVQAKDISRNPDAFTGAYAKAALQWRFRPGTRFSRPVAVSFTTTVSVKCK